MIIEQVIYWTGVTALLSVGFLVIGACLYFGSQIFMHCITNELARCHRHVTLYFVMRQVRKKGYSKTIEWIAEEHDKPWSN